MSEPGEDLVRSSESGDEGREEEEVGESEDWQKLEEVGDRDSGVSHGLNIEEGIRRRAASATSCW